MSTTPTRTVGVSVTCSVAANPPHTRKVIAMKAWETMPGVPAAGHYTSGGAWHPGQIDGCPKCPTPRWQCPRCGQWVQVAEAEHLALAHPRPARRLPESDPVVKAAVQEHQDATTLSRAVRDAMANHELPVSKVTTSPYTHQAFGPVWMTMVWTKADFDQVHVALEDLPGFITAVDDLYDTQGFATVLFERR